MSSLRSRGCGSDRGLENAELQDKFHTWEKQRHHMLYIMHELIDCCYIAYGMELCPDYTHLCVGFIDLSMLLAGEAISNWLEAKG